MRFVATRFERDAEYGEEFEAPSWTEAERICEENAWRLDGELKHTLTGITDEDANEIIAALNERDDDETTVQ